LQEAHQALDKVTVRLDSRCVVAILPKGSFAFLPLVEFLTGSSCNELHGPRDDLPFTTVKHQKMDVVGRGHGVQDAQAIALLCLE
jgi:hypothetical protein